MPLWRPWYQCGGETPRATPSRTETPSDFSVKGGILLGELGNTPTSMQSASASPFDNNSEQSCSSVREPFEMERLEDSPININRRELVEPFDMQILEKGLPMIKAKKIRKEKPLKSKPSHNLKDSMHASSGRNSNNGTIKYSFAVDDILRESPQHTLSPPIAVTPAYKNFLEPALSFSRSIPSAFSPVVPTASSTTATAVLPISFTFPQYYFNPNANPYTPSQFITSAPEQEPARSYQLIIPSPPSTPTLQQPVVAASELFTEEEMRTRFKTKKCWVKLVKLTNEDIEALKQKVRREYKAVPPPPPRPPSIGKQLHLLKQVCGPGRGRPKKTTNGQCVVASNNPMKVKIVKMSNETVEGGIDCNNLKNKDDGNKQEVGSITVNKQSGFKRESNSQPILPKKMARVMTPRRDVMSSTDYCFSPYRSRFWTGGKGSMINLKLANDLAKTRKSEGKKAKMSDRVSVHGSSSSSTKSTVVHQKKITSTVGSSKIPVTATTSTFNHSLFPQGQIKRKQKKTERKERESGNNWVTELLSTNLATEVVNEAARSDHYLPNVDIIQKWTEGNVDIFSDITDLESGFGSTFPPTEAVPQQDAKFRNAKGKKQGRQGKRKTSSQIKKEFEFYEDLYRNDILLINAEDEALPLPF